jgi:hypothetical protein
MTIPSSCSLANAIETKSPTFIKAPKLFNIKFHHFALNENLGGWNVKTLGQLYDNTGWTSR